MALLKKKAQVITKAEKILTPTQNRIFSMDRDIMIKHYALIVLMMSRMSREERRLVTNRINFGLAKGTIQQNEIDEAVAYIQQYIFYKEPTKQI